MKHKSNNRILWIILLLILLLAGIAYLFAGNKSNTSQLSPTPIPNAVPVVFVPGIGTSFNSSRFLGIGSDTWGWSPTAKKYYQGLIGAMAARGYTEDNGLFTVAFYDWRQPLDEGAKDLEKTIEQVKEKTGAKKVNLVTHSMGGLISRAYIQGNTYNDDVRDLITVGTPHYGSANAYFSWEGGELYGWGLVTNIALSAYAFWTNPDFPSLGTYGLIHQKIRGIRELLPVGDYLADTTNSDVLKPAASLLDAKNANVVFLNQNIATLFERTDTVTMIQGTELDTIQRIFVKQRSGTETLKWTDGEPVYERTGEPGNETLSEGETPEGDGTVLFSSATITDPSIDNKKVAGKHSELLNNSEVQTIIFDKLDIPLPPGDFSPKTYASALVYITASPITLEITNPSGNIISINKNDIAGAEYTTAGANDDPKSLVVIPDAIAGTYTVRVIGTANGRYHLGVSHITEQTNTGWTTYAGTIRKGETQIYTITYQPRNSRIPVGAVPSTGIQINNGNEETTTPSVSLRLFYPKDMAEMRISNIPFTNITNTLTTLSLSPWRSVTSSIDWQLSSGNGKKTVYVQYRERNGKTTNIFTDSIFLNPTEKPIQ